MLRNLSIREFVIAERVELEAGQGFTVLTGETGAGKSILVDALELLVGGRADPSVVREAAERAELAAEFDLDAGSPLVGWLDEAGLAGDPGSLLLRRTIDRSGRSRCFVNGHAATLTQVREVGEHLVDIHGQHAHQSLLRSSAQRALLDAQAGNETLARETAEAFRVWRRLEQRAAEAEAQHAGRERARAEIAEQVAGLAKLGVRDAEWDALIAEHSRLAHGSSLLAGAQSSLETLSEADAAAIPQLAAVASRLRALSGHDAGLLPIAELLESAEAQAAEAARALRHYASRVELDPEALRAAEARIEALHAAARRHRVKPEALPELLRESQARLAELELAVDPQALQREVDAAAQVYRAAAARLSERRAVAGRSLGGAVTKAMQQLAMAGGRFAVTLRALDSPAAGGLEEVEFEVSSHPSLPLRPLAKVASGGELSRISLAVQLVASKSSPVATLVFDEVDSGIGGAVAETVGRSLAKLGKDRQVLCVTHLPQVAARADAQWTVTRASERGRVACAAAPITGAARVEELARMLGGAQITATTRKHAAEMLGKG